MSVNDICYPVLVLGWTLVFVTSGCSRPQEKHSYGVNDGEKNMVKMEVNTSGNTLNDSALKKTATNGGDLPQIENDIARVREMVLDGRKMSPDYVTNVCKQISEIADFQTRSRLFEQLEESAFSVDFSLIGDIHEPDDDRRDEVVRRLGRSYAFLELLADEIHTSRMFGGDPPREHFEPLFRYFRTMSAESKRRGHSVRGYPKNLDRIEKLYGFSLKTGLFATNEYQWVRETFRELAGREMRTHEQILADEKGK